MSSFSSHRNFLGTKETSLLLMAMFLLAVFYHGQQVTHKNSITTSYSLLPGPFSKPLKTWREHGVQILDKKEVANDGS